jgi:hypothetical protein
VSWPAQVAVAVHFERGRDAARTVQYLWRAAANAMQRSTYPEALQRLTKALAVLTALPETPERH